MSMATIFIILVVVVVLVEGDIRVKINIVGYSSSRPEKIDNVSHEKENQLLLVNRFSKTESHDVSANQTVEF